MSRDTNYQITVIEHLKKIIDKLSGPTSNGGGVSTELDILQELISVKQELEGQNREIKVEEAITDGVTYGGVQSVSLLFMGHGGTIDNITVSEGTGFKFCPNKGSDTVKTISYTVPTQGDRRIIISYVY